LIIVGGKFQYSSKACKGTPDTSDRRQRNYPHIQPRRSGLTLDMPIAPRSIASLSISFGLVSIPVKLYPATVASERISFHWLRAKDSSRVRQQFIAVKDDKPVDRTDLVKGYEFSKNEYVTFAPEELKQLEDATTHSIDILQFVPLESVDPVYFYESFYLAPDKGGGKPYSLLSRALGASGQCAIGRWVLRGREHMVVIRSVESGLAIHQLHFKAEVRTMKDLDIKSVPVSDAELKLANQLIGQLAAKRFDASEYKDEFHARVKAAIARKVKGKEVSIAEEEPSRPASNVIDLMAALRASLGTHAGHSGGSDRRAPKRATTATPSRARRTPSRRA
jgi:DNA end-binding protein Ku